MTGRASIAAWRICVLTDTRLSRGRPHEQIVRAAIAGGADAVQFRDKESGGRRLYETALTLRRICAEAGVPFIVNDRVDLALAVDADGVHVGQDDLPAPVARRLIGPDRLLGVSASTAAEACRACGEGADYIGFGPVFDATATKPDAAPPTDLAVLTEVARRSPIPVVAIGGIHEANAAAVARAGATAVAVISAVVTADDVADAVRRLRAAVVAGRVPTPATLRKPALAHRAKTV